MLLAADAQATTAIPTWVGVLFSVSAVLVPALTGLLGALIGGRAGTRAAAEAARARGAVEQNTWIREHRKAAYGAFLAARNRYAKTYDEAERAGSRTRDAYFAEEEAREARGDPPNPERKAQLRRDREDQQAQVRAAREVLNSALADIELFGSIEAREAARNWIDEVDSRHEYMVQFPEEFSDLQWVRELDEKEAQQHRDPFLQLIRKELGVDA